MTTPTDLRALARKAADGDPSALEALTACTVQNPDNAEAHYFVGLLYDSPSAVGSTLPPDFQRARASFLAAAKLGHPLAQYSLGNMLDYGEGGDRDLIEARQWYAEAARQGVRDAQMHFGRMLETGRGGPEDKEEAARWYLLAIDQGDEYAATNLALMHLRGELADSQPDLAFKLLLFAADHLDGIAHLYLSHLYAQGQVTQPHTGKALLHCCIAALLLPEGPNKDLAIERREGIFAQFPERRKEFEDLALDYVRDKGGRLQ